MASDRRGVARCELYCVVYSRRMWGSGRGGQRGSKPGELKQRLTRVAVTHSELRVANVTRGAASQSCRPCMRRDGGGICSVSIFHHYPARGVFSAVGWDEWLAAAAMHSACQSISVVRHKSNNFTRRRNSAANNPSIYTKCWFCVVLEVDRASQLWSFWENKVDSSLFYLPLSNRCELSQPWTRWKRWNYITLWNQKVQCEAKKTAPFFLQ